MSVCLGFGDGAAVEIASNRGYAEFARFAELLEGAPEIAHLVTYGWSQNVAELLTELEEAGSLAEKPVAAVVLNITEAIEENATGVVIVTDGLSPVKASVKHRTKCGGEGSGKPGPCPEPGTEETAAPARQHVITQVLAKAGDLKHAGEAVASRLGQSVWSGLSPKTQAGLAATYAAGLAVYHVAESGFAKGKQMAMAVAKERGLPAERAEQVGRLLAIVDQAFAWTVNFPAATAATGSMTAGKVASFLPVASLGYIAYSTARNPFAAIRAARITLSTAAQHKSMAIVEAVARLLEHGGDEWYLALVSVALDAKLGLAEAIDVAESAYRKQPTMPEEGSAEEWGLIEFDQVRKSAKSSYFSECSRDEAGHCEESGEQDRSGLGDETAGKVNITIDKTAASRLKKLIGGDDAAHRAAMMAGAMPGAEVRIDPEGRTGIVIDVEHPKYRAIRVIQTDKNGTKVLVNDSIYVKEEFRGKGFGTEIFAQQVEQAAKEGFAAITTNASGYPGSTVNGYYTWPRLGYDAPLMISNPFGAKRLSDLMKTAQGRAWWKEHGSSIKASFDLSKNSLSRRVLHEYRKRRAR